MLQQLHKINSSKMQFTDGEDIDMERIGKLIMEISREATRDPKKAEKEIDSREIHRNMQEIEKQVVLLLDLKREIFKNPKHKTEFLDPLERKLKQLDKKYEHPPYTHTHTLEPAR